MRHNHFYLLACVLVVAALAGCKGQKSTSDDVSEVEAPKQLTEAHYVRESGFDAERAFIVISKKECKLSVYAPTAQGDTVLVAEFPACLSKNKGNKEGKGDMRTPESPAGKPFKISQIQDASTWEHDFGDGRGKILAYGHWFLRLDTPGHSGIGIHGSTNNRESVPGRASEGCVRLLDEDIDSLKVKYAYVGMPVTIKGEEEGPLPFELKAR